MADSYTALLTLGLAVYVALFVVAAVSDVVRFVIPNAVVVALVVLFSAVSLAVPLGTDWLAHLGAAALVLAIGAAAYRWRVLGAGDVKLLTAGALWAGWAALPAYIIHVTLAGAVLGVSLFLVRNVLTTVLLHIPRQGSVFVPRLLMQGEGIPYGVAIAVGSIMVSGQLPHLGLYL